MTAQPVYWSIRDIEFHCRVSRATAWRLVRSPGFPSPVVLGAKTLRWRRAEVEGFVDARSQPERYSRGEADGRHSTGYVARAVRTR